MHAILNRASRVLQIGAAVFPLVAFAASARADIFQWEYINPLNPGQGKRQSTTLCPDGTGVDAVPGAFFRDRNLTMAYLIGADLTGADAGFANLSRADLSDADLTNANLANAYFVAATLTGAQFADAAVRGASFSKDAFSFGYDTWFLVGTGITPEQLYATATYQAHDLSGIGFAYNDLAGGNFARQNLTNSSFYAATLTGADFTDAEVRGANFGINTYAQRGTGITPAQLYSTASYAAHDLTGIFLAQNSQLAGADFSSQNLSNAYFDATNLTGANFGEANLTNASLLDATLANADFTGTEVRGANLNYAGISLAQLYSTVSYQTQDLSGIRLSGNNLTGANFADKNLTNAYFGGTSACFDCLFIRPAASLDGTDFTNADVRGTSFSGANLTGANFTGAEIQGASFGRYRATCGWAFCDLVGGITVEQLYSTASYQAHDLSGIDLNSNDLSGGDFVGQNVSNAYFGGATLTDADFSQANLVNADFYAARLTSADLHQANLTNALFGSANLTDADFAGADARGAYFDNLSGAITTNLIRPDGHIDGLTLDTDGPLLVRDYDGRPDYGTAYPPIPITIDQHLAMAPGGTLRMVFEADAWDSTISFAPGIPVTLGATLELTFADDVNLATQLGRTFDVFNWTGVTPTGAFAISSPYAWDLSNLYTTGEVTLTAIPEPSAFLYSSVALCAFFAIGRVRVSSNSAEGENPCLPSRQHCSS
jgi:uncharacterized protein YjbI with pentapeptide repeats